MSASLLNKKIYHPHYSDVIMSRVVSQITSLMMVYSTVYSGAVQRKYQSSALLAFVQGIHRSPVNSPHKGPVTQKIIPFDDVIMIIRIPIDETVVTPAEVPEQIRHLYTDSRIRCSEMSYLVCIMNVSLCTIWDNVCGLIRITHLYSYDNLSSTRASAAPNSPHVPQGHGQGQ